jgi:hypothetical protein
VIHDVFRLILRASLNRVWSQSLLDSTASTRAAWNKEIPTIFESFMIFFVNGTRSVDLSLQHQPEQHGTRKYQQSFAIFRQWGKVNLRVVDGEV